LGKTLVVGGAGFIGCNAAKRFGDAGDSVAIFDNLSRKGTRENLEWLKEQVAVEAVVGDIRNYDEIAGFFKEHNDANVVVHMAAQVAVTTSVTNPREDFEINALGTFNVLEAMREHLREAVLVFASTNKVYGGMEDVAVGLRDNRYQYENLPKGVSEDMPLDFHSPYGCSKGCADQYVRDYSRIYGLKTVVLRQSCIYGYRQFGIEDQGWVAWFTIATALEHPIVIYGDGKQVRDVLFIEDLLDAFQLAAKHPEKHSGQIYNIGGGPANTMSLLELISFLQSLSGRDIEYSFADWRPGDQQVFVSDIRRAKDRMGWSPKVSPKEGVSRLYEWVMENRQLFVDLDIC
jgi:CDP-paratose 2-epimerase